MLLTEREVLCIGLVEFLFARSIHKRKGSRRISYCSKQNGYIKVIKTVFPMFPHKSWPLGSFIPTDNFLSSKHLRVFLYNCVLEHVRCLLFLDISGCAINKKITTLYTEYKSVYSKFEKQ